MMGLSKGSTVNVIIPGPIDLYTETCALPKKQNKLTSSQDVPTVTAWYKTPVLSVHTMASHRSMTSGVINTTSQVLAADTKGYKEVLLNTVLPCSPVPVALVKQNCIFWGGEKVVVVGGGGCEIFGRRIVLMVLMLKGT